MLTRRHLFHSLPLAIFTLSAGRASADPAAKVIGEYSYREWIVNSTSDNPALPIVIGLHWSSSSPEEFRAYFNGLRKPARLIFLSGRYPFKGGYSFYSRSPVNYYAMEDAEQQDVVATEAAKIADVIALLGKTYPHAPKPIVIGASQGGDLAYALAILYGQLLKGSIPLLASLHEDLLKTQSAHRLPIRVFHGVDDKIVAIAATRAHADRLAKAGYNIVLKEYANLGHDISPQMQHDFSDAIDQAFE